MEGGVDGVEVQKEEDLLVLSQHTASLQPDHPVDLQLVDGVAGELVE